jgi:hypothetical protein
VNNSTVYCHFELERFPKSEFYRDEEGRRIHRTEPLHTSEGALIEDPGLPPHQRSGCPTTSLKSEAVDVMTDDEDSHPAVHGKPIGPVA